jgi:hypothetical protein
MSRTYQRTRKGGLTIDPDAYETYRIGVAFRILRRRHGNISRYDAWQLAAIPAFFLWVFRGPINFFKRRKADRRLRNKLKSNRNNPSTK